MTSVETVARNYFYLGKYPPCQRSTKELEQIVRLGREPDLRDIYSYWVEELKRTVEFYAVNREQIEKVRAAIKESFLNAVIDAELYALRSGLEGFYVAGDWTQPVTEQQSPFQPLSVHAVRQSIASWDKVLGTVRAYGGT